MYGKSDTDFPGTRLLNVIACINAGFDISGMILILALMFIGGELTIRSVSRNLSKEDKLEEIFPWISILRFPDQNPHRSMEFSSQIP